MSGELTVDQLYRTCDPATLGGQDSSQIGTLQTIIGQERAVRALRFGLGIKDAGFNIYVAGKAGTGRITAIQRFLEEVAANQATPPDTCYVNDFHDSYRPRVMLLPAGQAVKFRADMERFVGQVAAEIKKAFESEDYSLHRDAAVKKIEDQKRERLENLNEQALKLNFSIQASPAGLLTIPMHDGKPITEEGFLALKPEERERLTKTRESLETTIETVVRQVKGLDKDAADAVQKLDTEVALYALKHLLGDLRTRYQDVPAVQTHLDHVQTDILENLADFKAEPEPAPQPPPFLKIKREPLRKYTVNVMVDNSTIKGAPVVIERNPTYANLFGRIEQEASFGALTTDFTLIRPGSMHRANGGYLVLPIEEVITSPLSWDSLKHALQNREIVIEDVADKLGVISTKSLKPEPVPLDVKVVLIGRADTYQLLLQADERFNELFKVKADFDTRMPRTDDNIRNYAAFVSRLCTNEHLTHFDGGAMARIVEYGSRLSEDQDKLSTHFGRIADVIREAAFYARAESASRVSAAHVRRALEERLYRSDLIQERIQEMIVRDEIKIAVDGSQVGQVNGLSVIQMGDIEFGQPNRITVSIGMGREGVVNIEREAMLSGPIHTKGVLILSGYLADKYAQDKPLSLAARLVFEQSYSGVEGDSASSAELYAILSALSGLPLNQAIAVTGSVNQKGEVQAIGGVNEKIEGFFAVCKAKGLTGKQGALIPQSNIPNLMLKDEVLEAVKAGQFHVWSASTIAEGIELLTGVPAGERGPDGGFEASTVNGRVDQRLKELANKLAEFGRKDEKADAK